MDQKKLVNTLITLGVALVAMVGYFIYQLSGGVVVGVTANAVAGGAINVSDAMDTHLAATEGEYIDNAGNLNLVVPTIISLITVVVIISIFFGDKFSFGSLGRKGGGGMQ